jgi:hypothetical protein
MGVWRNEDIGEFCLVWVVCVDPGLRLGLDLNLCMCVDRGSVSE